ncbi:acetylglutamate kinase [Pseudidiomarina sp. 1APP75-32.1]|uniref:Acetylglutamate kinase n=1 Tax=Pseudidiomarina terrestris TaxID=2820060 RepID=A0AAW7R214_9GAMM|nr:MULTISPECIES: acetylglutamate kinase [unclassified Pseudidiomarina]MDN7124801.1 acetylglutamate kinase [Pseudidiomarina sp. 1APP75-32.1]MDN7129725.1 acetylglutamate kinase [Pseudidiomarina sp. 1APR75-15]
MTTPLVIKIGGRVLTDPTALSQLFSTVQKLAALRPLVLVHGGGDQVQALLQRLGDVSAKTDGQRVTPAAQMPIVAGVLAGDLNSQLCAIAQQHGLASVGLTLQAGSTVRCEVDTTRGAVGIPQPHSSKLLELLLDANYLPILSSIGLSADGQRLNINADLAAGAVAQVLHADLILLTDVAGILDRDGLLIDSIDATQVLQLISDGIVRDGMVVKLNAALQAAQHSRRSIAVAGWQDANALTRLAKGEAAGTRIRF